MHPERIQLRRTAGWRMPAGTVKVDRTTAWGNPFVVGRDGTAAQCVARFAACLAGDPESPHEDRFQIMRHRLHQLRGQHLACWCALGAPCHGDVLLRMANGPQQP